MSILVEDHEDGKDSDKENGTLKNHLNGLYAGMTKMIPSTAKENKSPFLVEKAMHNIMFIKHHMKRQDEFDAVSKPRNFFFQISRQCLCRRIKTGAL